MQEGVGMVKTDMRKLKIPEFRTLEEFCRFSILKDLDAELRKITEERAKLKGYDFTGELKDGKYTEVFITEFVGNGPPRHNVYWRETKDFLFGYGPMKSDGKNKVYFELTTPES